jgi:hypothetical protein
MNCHHSPESPERQVAERTDEVESVHVPDPKVNRINRRRLVV